MKNNLPALLLSHRQTLRWLGGTAAWVFASSVLARRTAATGQPSVCLFRPEQTEGPYFVDEDLRRSDVRSDPTTGEITPGVPLALTVALSRLDAGGVCPYLARRSTSGIATHLASIPMGEIPGSIRPAGSFYAATNSRTQTAKRGFSRYTPAGMPAGLCTYISRSARPPPSARWSSLPRCTSRTAFRTASMRARLCDEGQTERPKSR